MNKEIAALLDRLYEHYHRPEYISPDPLETLYAFDDDRDREVFGLIAAAFALGRVCSILDFLERLRAAFPDPNAPAASLMQIEADDLLERFGVLRYRFYNGVSIASFLLGISSLLKRYGGLKEAFSHHLKRSEGDMHTALCGFTGELSEGGDLYSGKGIAFRPVLPDPSAGSASKRLHLYLRWMVRSDEIDPGCWSSIADPKDLLVPVDTHMLQAAQRLGFTQRRSGDLRTAREVTEALKVFDLYDPVRYDFCITRSGILSECVEWPV